MTVVTGRMPALALTPIGARLVFARAVHSFAGSRRALDEWLQRDAPPTRP